MLIFHCVGHFLYYYSPAIQAACAFLALVGLAIYAFDARAIRKATIAQSDASRRPFLDLFANDFSSMTKNAYSIRNNGAGPAISVAWVPAGIPDAAPLFVGALSVGATARLGGDQGNLDEEGFDEQGAVAIVYSDAAGRDYVQMFLLRGDDLTVRNVVLSKHSKRKDETEAARFRAGTNREWQARYLTSSASEDDD